MSTILLVISLVIAVVVSFLMPQGNFDVFMGAFVVFGLIFVLLGYVVAGVTADSACTPSGVKRELKPIPSSVVIKNKFYSQIYVSYDGLGIEHQKYNPDKHIIALTDGPAYLEEWIYTTDPKYKSILLRASGDTCEWHYYVPDQSYYLITN